MNGTASGEIAELQCASNEVEDACDHLCFAHQWGFSGSTEACEDQSA